MKPEELLSHPESAMHIEKFVHARVTELLSDRILMNIWMKFGGEVFRRSSVLYGLDSFLTRNKIKGESAIEIGTRNGLTAVVLARHFERVITFDIEPSLVKHDIFKCAGVDHKILAFDITSNEQKQKLIAKAIGFDFAYLDGDHEKDTQFDFNLVKRCGRILFHEAWPSQKPVWDLVHSLPQNEVVYGMFNSALWVHR